VLCPLFRRGFSPSDPTFTSIGSIVTNSRSNPGVKKECPT
jgi:hypothetical protein